MVTNQAQPLPAARAETCPVCDRDAAGHLTCNICDANGRTLYFDSGSCWTKHQKQQHAGHPPAAAVEYVE